MVSRSRAVRPKHRRLEEYMEVGRIIAELDAQISKLQQARALLAGTTPPAVPAGRGRPKGSKNAVAAAKVSTPRKKRKLSPEGRKAYRRRDEEAMGRETEAEREGLVDVLADIKGRRLELRRRPFRLARCLMSHLKLPGDDDLTEAVLCKEEPVVTELGQHIFDLAITEDMQQGVVARVLHLDDVGICEMVTAERVIRSRCGVEEGEHETSGLQHLMNPREDRCEKSFGQIVCRIPENDDIELAPGKIEIGLKEAFYIELQAPLLARPG